MKRKVTIQGVAGCFHDEAAREYFRGSEIDTIECDTFEQMMGKLQADASLTGIMAIENSIAGPLLENHELLRLSHLQIVGEIGMRVSHCLCALPGQKLEDITEVWSHPMALRQCEQWLMAHPKMRWIEKFDTAGSAAEIAAGKIKGVGAICSRFAAEKYGLQVLAPEIETSAHNYTRFLILADPSDVDEFATDEGRVDKSSIVFTLPHTQGSLSKVLSILSYYDTNLTKIQSMPIVGRQWEYRFYADLAFSSYTRYLQGLEAVRPLINDLRILGEYAEYKK